MHRGDDGLAAGGFFGEAAGVHLGPMGQQQSARDWGCGHHQHVCGCALFAQGETLVDTETMLLVDHRQAQIVKLHALLKQ